MEDYKLRITCYYDLFGRLFVAIDILCVHISIEMIFIFVFRFNHQSLAVAVRVQFYLQRMQLAVRLNSSQNLWFWFRLPAKQQMCKLIKMQFCAKGCCIHE